MRRVSGIRTGLATGAVGVLLLLGCVSAASVIAGDDACCPLHKMPLVDLSRAGQGKSADPAYLEQLEIRRARDREIHELLGERFISRRSLRHLEAQGLGPALLGRSPESLRRTATKAAPDTLHVLLIRIGFETDRGGTLTSCDTGGDFMLDGNPRAVPDPPPHDKAFFETQIKGLEYFYNSMSGNRLVIDATVLPEGDRDCWKLTDVADYAPDEGWTVEALEALVRDMIALADTTLADAPLGSEIRRTLADFDDDDENAYVIFAHAGADWQSDIAGDSPWDIPTFFIELGEPQNLVGLDTSSDEPGAMSNCSIIPETTTQDGWAGGILASLCHEFGHALGLPDVYSPLTGAVNAGYWTLMDAGTNRSGLFVYDFDGDGGADTTIVGPGILPPSLGAWEKWYLGWLDVERFDGDEREIRLPAVQVGRTREEYLFYEIGVEGHDYSEPVAGTDYYYTFPGYDFDIDDPQALIGGASANEFFLVENRWVPDYPFDFPDVTGVGAVHAENQVILYMGGDAETEGGTDWRNTGMYDYFMPVTGLLVWHVNMDRIAAELETNSINDWQDGLRLVEADGIPDIGIMDAYVSGWAGSSRDPYNDIPRGFHGDEIWDRLNADEAPSSRAYDRSWTGFEFSGAAGVDTNHAVMRIDVRNMRLDGGGLIELPPIGDFEAARFGVDVGTRPLDPSTVTATTVYRGAGVDPLPVLLCSDARRAGDEAVAKPLRFFCFDYDGVAVEEPPGPAFPEGAFDALSAPAAGPPLARRLKAFGAADEDAATVMVGMTDGMLRAWQLDVNLDAKFAPFSLGSRMDFGPVALSDELVLCSVGADSLVLIDGVGTILDPGLPLENDLGVAITGFVSAPRATSTEGRGLVFAREGCFVVSAGAAGLTAERFPWPRQPVVGELLRPALVPAAGGDQLVVYGDDGLLASWQLTAAGELTAMDWTGDPGAALIAEPAVADVNGDGFNDVVAMTAKRVFVCGPGGVSLLGFPVEVNGLFPVESDPAIVGGAVVCDAVGSENAEILLRTDGGHLFGLDGRGRLLEGMPFLVGDDHEASLNVGVGAEEGRTLWVGTAGGESELYGNEIGRGRIYGYHLAASAGNTSEWLGPRGGAARGGPVGTPRSIGAASVALAERDRFMVYPNPLSGVELTVRFQTPVDHTARLVIYDLEGEIVDSIAVPATGGVVNETRVQLPELAPGLYLCQLDRQTSSGRQQSVLTLAIER